MRAYILATALAAVVLAAGCGDSAEKPGVCGDGHVDSAEQCDDGSANGTAGDPCNASCQLVCSASSEGASCGTGMVCHSSQCVAVVCGDGKMEAGEQCDDGAKNGTAGDACTKECKFACNADSDCGDSNACNGTETCSNHVCKPGTALAEGASCGNNQVCHSNACVSITCGDGKMDTGEECDDGAKNGTTGDPCDASCHFSCKVDADCNDSKVCNGTEVCTNHVCGAGAPPPEGSDCGTGMVCQSQECKPITCGDGIKEGNEECDGGEGCRADCTFECGPTHPATECQKPACQGAVCSANHTCATVASPDLEATPCDATHPANVCIGGACTAPPACDKFVCAADRTCRPAADPSLNGNVCDPNQPTNVCVFGSCQAPACGDKVREAGEQCDDGDLLNLDGCDSDCKFEPAARVTSLEQQFATSAFCPNNRLGTAFGEFGQAIIQQTWDQPVKDGTQSIVFKFLGLTDLTGQNSTFKLGFVNARAGGRTLVPLPRLPTCGNGICEESPQPLATEWNSPDGGCPADCTYDGNNDLDWWYIRDPASVDRNETPLVQLAGQVTNGHLSAGPGTIQLQLLFAFEPAQVNLFNTKVEATLDPGLSSPLISTSGATPGHLASENLAPTLKTFSTSSEGAMCSEVSVESLFNAPMPVLLQQTCQLDDGSFAFTAANRLLDAFIVGCAAFGQPTIDPTQPDGSTDGASYAFGFDPATRTVTSCTKNGQPALLSDCVKAASYSSYFKFKSDRVIIKRN